MTVETRDPDRLPAGPWTAWHEDGFTLPPLAYELASNAFGVQAFCHCRDLALEFHPEVTPAIAPTGPRTTTATSSAPALGVRISRCPRARRRPPRSCSTGSPPGRPRAGSLPRVKHEHTHHVAADADKVYAALADVRNLPHYVPADDEGGAARRRQGHGRGALRRPHPDGRGLVQDRRRKAPDRVGLGGQRLQRLAAGRPDEDGSRLTLYVATVHGDAPDPEVMGTLDAIRRLVEADVSPFAAAITRSAIAA